MEDKMNNTKKNWKRFYGAYKFVGIGIDFLCGEVGSKLAGEVANRLLPGAGIATTFGAKLIGRGIGMFGAHESMKDLDALMQAADGIIDPETEETEVENEDSKVEPEVVIE